MSNITKTSYLLEAGHIYFTKDFAVIQVVLGSCVSVCLWDSRLLYGGMNHFVYPATLESAKATPVYGNVATIALLKMMTEAGSRIRDIKAHILGGGHPENMKEDKGVGTENIKVARDILKKKGVVIASEDVGGIMGRKIVFDTQTGQVAVLKVHKIREEDWAKK